MTGGDRTSPDRWAIRPMSEGDLSAVMEVARTGLHRPWSEAIWRSELRSRFAEYLVLEAVDELLGFVGVQRVADEAHVMTLAVRPESRRKGLGRTLTQAALSSSALQGARRVHLEVRPSNAAARGLYASLGFVETGYRKNYYGDEDALLMTLSLPGGPRLGAGIPRASSSPPAPARGAGEAPRGPRRV